MYKESEESRKFQYGAMSKMDLPIYPDDVEAGNYFHIITHHCNAGSMNYITERQDGKIRGIYVPLDCSPDKLSEKITELRKLPWNDKKTFVEPHSF